MNGFEEKDHIRLSGCIACKNGYSFYGYGLEARYPFLDQKLVQRANRLPQTAKLSGIIARR